MLFDTTFVIDLEREFIRNRPSNAVRFLEQHREAVPHISIITVYEFAEGFGSAQQQACFRALSRYKILRLTKSIAWQAGQISRNLREVGLVIGDNDILIAATAIGGNLPLVTKNLQHFQRIAALRLLSY